MQTSMRPTSVRSARPMRTAGRCAALVAPSGKGIAPPKHGQKHFLHIDDFTSDELRAMLRNAAVSKAAFYNRDQSFKPFAGYSMAMVFTKPSARTRVSFETVRSRCDML